MGELKNFYFKIPLSRPLKMFPFTPSLLRRNVSKFSGEEEEIPPPSMLLDNYLIWFLGG